MQCFYASCAVLVLRVLEWRCPRLGESVPEAHGLAVCFSDPALRDYGDHARPVPARRGSPDSLIRFHSRKFAAQFLRSYSVYQRKSAAKDN
jgi:hypothetical protein